MRPCSSGLRIVAAILCATACALPVAVSGAEPQRTGQLVLRPHCERAIESLCPQFSAKDPTTLSAGNVYSGDTLDLDVVLMNPSLDPVWDFRLWLAYDPALFDGVGIKPGDAFPASIPGETDFSTSDGFVKLRASRTGTKVNGKLIVLGRIVLKVKKTAAPDTSILSFHDVGADGTSSTFVRSAESEPSILAIQQGALSVSIVDGTGEASTASSSLSSAVSSLPDIIIGSTSSVTDATPPETSSASSALAEETQSSEAPSKANPATGDRTTFALLQIQKLRAGTEGSTVYITWNPLHSSSLIGYNLYYGTRSGEYLQRRSIVSTGTSTALRTLPQGATYYLAVRGVSASGEETAFSQEVRITVGNPKTSSAPVRGKMPNPVTGNDTVPGATGVPQLGIIALFACAILCTLSLLRRQLRSR